MSNHKLKLNAEFYDDVKSGRKPFEVRLNDRGYQCGDMIQFRKFENGCESAFDTFHKRITYVLSGWGIENNYVVLGLENETK